MIQRKVDGFTRVILGTNFLDLTRVLSKNCKSFHGNRICQTMKKVKGEDIDILTELKGSGFQLTESDHHLLVQKMNTYKTISNGKVATSKALLIMRLKIIVDLDLKIS